MTVLLDRKEVQIAVADYLRKKGLIIDDADQVELRIWSNNYNSFTNIIGAVPVIVVEGVKLPEGGPYR